MWIWAVVAVLLLSLATAVVRRRRSNSGLFDDVDAATKGHAEAIAKTRGGGLTGGPYGGL
jgi:hypothetical protein